MRPCLTPPRCTALAALLASACAWSGPPDPAPGGEWVYTVHPDDAPRRLAEQQLKPPYSWKDLSAYNRIKEPGPLLPGQQIRVPLAWMTHTPLTAHLVSIAGAVQVQLPEQPVRPARAGERLAVGARVITGGDQSAALVFVDGSRLVVAPHSELLLDTLSLLGTQMMVDTRVRLRSGRVEAKVHPAPTQGPPTRRFRISAPAALSTARGTQFGVSASSSELTLRQTWHGLVELSAEGLRVLVHPGQGGVGGRDRPAQDTQASPAPARAPQTCPPKHGMPGWLHPPAACGGPSRPTESGPPPTGQLGGAGTPLAAAPRVPWWTAASDGGARAWQASRHPPKRS